MPAQPKAQASKSSSPGAGGAAAFAWHDRLPRRWFLFLEFPVESKRSSLDSLLSMAQMPGGIPVGTLAIGKREPSTLHSWPPPR